ncbi:glycoside hydrolase domain-containing protein [Bacillus horti]|nr:glycoside hydrolase domain-containing protein [Bacillus horti]
MFTDARGYQNGVNMAEDAIKRAEEIGAPEGVAIFANIEPIYPVDADFMMGWVETLSPSPYEAAIYGDFSEGHDVRAAFDQAVEVNPSILDVAIIWTHQPQKGITTRENAPEFNPGTPEEARALMWQYGIDAETCNIDTNLFKRKLLDYLW